MLKRIITFILTLLIIAGVIIGICFAIRSCASPKVQSSEPDYKLSYIGGNYYARNNVNDDLVFMTATKKPLGTGTVFTFKVANVEGYTADEIKCSDSTALIDVTDELKVTVTIPGEINRSTFSVMVFYVKST